jgi:hypothetical protein
VSLYQVIKVIPYPSKVEYHVWSKVSTKTDLAFAITCVGQINFEGSQKS